MYCLISNINTSKNKIILSLVTNTNTSGDPTCSSDCQRASEPLVAHILCLRTFTFFIAEAQGRMQRKQNVKNGLLPNGGRGMSARVVKNQTAIFGSKKCQKGLKWL